MSNWGHSHYKFIFFDDFNTDMMHEKLGKVVNALHTTMRGTDNAERLGYDGKVDDTYIKINNKQRQCWVYDVEVDDNFMRHYFDSMMVSMLPQKIQDDLKERDETCINEFCKHFKCVCEWMFSKESTMGCLERVVKGADGKLWFYEKEKFVDDSYDKKEPEDLATNPILEDIIGEHYEETAITLAVNS